MNISRQNVFLTEMRPIEASKNLTFELDSV